MTGIVQVVTARPRIVGAVVSIACPWCQQEHRHHWRKSDADPGPKQPPCRPRGTGVYFVRAPAWSREPSALDQVDRVAQLLYRLDVRTIDIDNRRAIAIAAASLSDAVERATGGQQ